MCCFRDEKHLNYLKINMYFGIRCLAPNNYGYIRYVSIRDENQVKKIWDNYCMHGWGTTEEIRK